LLRQRLRDLGYQVNADNGNPNYGPGLESAVRQFQADHGIDVDGVIGRQSYNFLNMSYRARVDSLRINMDRVRWISQSISDDYIVVNIAGFELYYHRGQEFQWETPVMTGTIQHQTPIFTAKLKYLEFNPIWTVPRSIIGRSLLPKFKANPQYVNDNNYHLYDRQGKLVDPMSIDWASSSISNFPYSVVQQPGDKNALGRVKFIFPNRHAVYLHDTPSRALFSRSARAFSSGCVRVKQPLEFASVLLNDPQRWSVEQVRDLFAGADDLISRAEAFDGRGFVDVYGRDKCHSRQRGLKGDWQVFGMQGEFSCAAIHIPGLDSAFHQLRHCLWCKVCGQYQFA
jgi:murein L,D-transpeptidase YcbB/YkuD